MSHSFHRLSQSSRSHRYAGGDTDETLAGLSVGLCSSLRNRLGHRVHGARWRAACFFGGLRGTLQAQEGRDGAAWSKRGPRLEANKSQPRMHLQVAAVRVLAMDKSMTSRALLPAVSSLILGGLPFSPADVAKCEADLRKRELADVDDVPVDQICSTLADVESRRQQLLSGLKAGTQCDRLVQAGARDR